MAEPTRPARTMAQITGVSSRVNAKPSRPPMTRVSPTLLNSLQNWIVNTMPTNEDVSIATPRLPLPHDALDHEPEQQERVQRSPHELRGLPLVQALVQRDRELIARGFERLRERFRRLLVPRHAPRLPFRRVGVVAARRRRERVARGRGGAMPRGRARRRRTRAAASPRPSRRTRSVVVVLPAHHPRGDDRPRRRDDDAAPRVASRRRSNRDRRSAARRRSARDARRDRGRRDARDRRRGRHVGRAGRGR
eukprot:30060-Pelagococcus_subviridis.AAC.4